MDEIRRAQGSSGAHEPSLVVPDSVGLVMSPAAASTAADTGLMLSGNKSTAAPLAASFADHGLPPPLKAPFTGRRTHGDDWPAAPVGPDDDLAVLPADLLGLLYVKDENCNRPSTDGAGDTPHVSAAGLQPAQLLPLPTVDKSPGWTSQPEPNEQREQPAEGSRSSYYSSAFENLAREVSGSEGASAGSSPASRPSLCACKKLAVAAMLRADVNHRGADDGGVGDGIAQRPGRVCPNRGQEADCFYRVFSDAPLVPSTTVSHKALSLVLHTHQSSAREAFHGGEGGARAYAGAIGGDAPGEVQPDGSDYETRKVPVEIRRWLMDGVASVHCTDTPLRDALMRLIPPALGQMHLSPDGSGQLIAVHIAAVPLLVQGIATIPGVSRLEGIERFSQVFPSQHSSAPLTTFPRKEKKDVASKAAAAEPASTADRQQPFRSQQPATVGGSGAGGGGVPHEQCSRRPMVAPVPVRASDMVSPSMWDLPNLGGVQGGDREAGAGTKDRPRVAATVGAADAAALVAASSSPPFVRTGRRDGSSTNRGGFVTGFAGGPSGHSCSRQTARANEESGGSGSGVSGSTATMTATNAALFSTMHEQGPGWEIEPPPTGVAWPQAAKIARDSSTGGDGLGGGSTSGGGGGGCGQTWTDSSVFSNTYGAHVRNRSITINTPQELPNYRNVSSGGSSSGSSSSGGGGGGFYPGQHAEVGSKRQKTSGAAPMPMSLPMPAAKATGLHLQGYTSLFGGAGGGYAAGAAPQESMPLRGTGAGLVRGVPNMLGEKPAGSVGGYGVGGGSSLGVLDGTGGTTSGLGFGTDDESGFGSGVDSGGGVGGVDGAGGFEIGSAWVDAVFDGGPPETAGVWDGVSLAPSSYLW